MKRIISSHNGALGLSMAAATVTVSVPAIHADPGNLRSNLVSLLADQGEQKAPAAHYVDEESQRGFVFDRSGTFALFKFDDEDEVVALTAYRAPRGEEVFKNDLGQRFLKVSQRGNITLYGIDDSKGSPAGYHGAAERIEIPNQPEDFGAELYALNQEVRVVIEDELSAYANWALDAAGLAAKGVTEVNRNKVDKISLVFSDAPYAEMDGNILKVGVAPHLGFGGRLSSQSIGQALEVGESD